MKDLIELIIIFSITYFSIKFIYNLIKDKINDLLTDDEEILKQEKMRYENTFFANDFYKVEDRLIRDGFDSDGAYIFTNKNTNEIYVGQSVDLVRRINQHLKGRGNEDVHDAIENGDTFTVRLIKLKNTNFSDLDALEKHYITKHNSYYMGYNKTKGNG